MLTVEDYARIRIAKRDGMSIREICKRFHHSHHTVTKALSSAEPGPYTRTKDPPAPVLGPFMHIIKQILHNDEFQPRKQRHRASKIYRRLRDEYGYKGSYDQVRRYVQKRRRKKRETFIPLDHDPGQRLEADFGHIYVDFPEGRKRVAVLLSTWSFSGFRFAMALPTEKIESVLTGMVNAFEFFGCVAREVWWDNPKTVVTQILKGRGRIMHKRFAALASHYMFEPLFCMPARGNEKPYVENSVFDLQRDWATPVPKVRDYDELNNYLRQCCLNKADHRVAGKSETVGERFAREKAAALPLSGRGFDPYVDAGAGVDKYQTVRFDNNRYSVPRRWAFEKVTVKAYPFLVRFIVRDTEIARHSRCYQRNQQILNPVHYLSVLGRRPATLEHSNVFRNWRLPSCFTELRQKLEQRHGPFAGARQYIRVLQLLASHPAARIQKAIERCLGSPVVHADTIINKVKHLAQSRQKTQPDEQQIDHYRVNVPKPDLNKFDQFLTLDKGEKNYVRQ